MLLLDHSKFELRMEWERGAERGEIRKGSDVERLSISLWYCNGKYASCWITHIFSELDLLLGFIKASTRIHDDV